MRNLAAWIFKNYPYSDAVTPLKFQKLFFYCYGALLAFDLEHEIGSEIKFEPWEHGPVNDDLYQLLKSKGSSPIGASDFGNRPVREYSAQASKVLRNTLKIYGAMGAWSIRNQTHREQPWRFAFDNQHQTIDPVGLKKYFKAKWSTGSVTAPEFIFGLSSFRIDGIPVQNYSSLDELAKAVDRVTKNKTQ